MVSASQLNAVSCVLVNVVASLLIVLVNKLTFNAGFRYVCSLTVFHQLSTALISLLRPSTSKATKAKDEYPITRKDALLYALFFNTSIVSMNLSLKLNTVGTYQMLKLGVVPTVALLESAFLAIKVHVPIYCALSGILQGSSLALLDDLQGVGVNFHGMCAGLLAIFSTASQTVLLKILQKKCNNSQQRVLLGTISLYSSCLLVCIAPILDTTLNEVTYREYSSEIVELLMGRASREITQALLSSCLIAALLNASQFCIIGKFSPLTFQVLGQVKMVGVLFLGALQLKEGIFLRKAVGTMVIIWSSWKYAVYKAHPSDKLNASPARYHIFAALGWACVLASSAFYPVRLY